MVTNSTPKQGSSRSLRSRTPSTRLPTPAVQKSKPNDLYLSKSNRSRTPTTSKSAILMTSTPKIVKPSPQKHGKISNESSKKSKNRSSSIPKDSKSMKNGETNEKLSVKKRKSVQDENIDDDHSPNSLKKTRKNPIKQHLDLSSIIELENDDQIDSIHDDSLDESKTKCITKNLNPIIENEKDASPMKSLESNSNGQMDPISSSQSLNDQIIDDHRWTWLGGCNVM